MNKILFSSICFSAVCSLWIKAVEVEKPQWLSTQEMKQQMYEQQLKEKELLQRGAALAQLKYIVFRNASPNDYDVSIEDGNSKQLFSSFTVESYGRTSKDKQVIFPSFPVRVDIKIQKKGGLGDESTTFLLEKDDITNLQIIVLQESGDGLILGYPQDRSKRIEGW